MKKIFYILFLIVFFHVYGHDTLYKKHYRNYLFIKNKGQMVDPIGKINIDVKYLLNTKGLNIQLRCSGFSYNLYKTEKIFTQEKNDFSDVISLYTSHPKKKNYTLKYNFHRIVFDFIHINQDVEIITEVKSIDYDHYYYVIGQPDGVLFVYQYQKKLQVIS